MATITMNASEVIAACQAVIQHIIDKRAKDEESLIAHEMSKTYHTWYFKPYRPTREQAIEKLDKSEYWGWKSEYAWDDLAHAKKLLKLARNGDPVTLNEKDTDVLF